MSFGQRGYGVSRARTANLLAPEVAIRRAGCGVYELLSSARSRPRSGRATLSIFCQVRS